MRQSILKKILVVAPYFYPKIGGVEKHIFNLYKGIFKKKRYEITILTTKYNSTVKEYELIEGMKIYRIPYQFKISNTPISFKWKKQINEIIKKEKPSIIMAHLPVPFMSDLTILLTKNIPIILKYHSGSMKKENGFFDNLLISIYEKFILRIVINKVDHLICTSDFVRDKFLKEYKSKSTTITPAVDINKFKPHKFLDNSIQSILYVGRIDKTSKWKGIKYLIDAFSLVIKKFPLARLSIVGGGDDLENQINYVKKLEIQNNIDFLGSLKGNKLTKIYQKSNLLVLPSTSEAESFGMVLIEAMACKKPVIGSNIGGIPYVIDHEKNGFLVPPRNPKPLAGAIIKILKNPELAKKMGENGYRKVRDNFIWDKKIEETASIIEAFIERRKNENNKK